MFIILCNRFRKRNKTARANLLTLNCGAVCAFGKANVAIACCSKDMLDSALTDKLSRAYWIASTVLPFLTRSRNSWMRIWNSKSLYTVALVLRNINSYVIVLRTSIFFKRALLSWHHFRASAQLPCCRDSMTLWPETNTSISTRL